MPVIELITEINAPIERCFNLSRSINLHLLSTSKTNEKAIAGVTCGLIGLGEQVTWRARHFGVYQNLTSKITAYQYPFYFKDIMIKGAFKKMEHDHWFEQKGDITIMKDRFYFEAPFGILGKMVSKYVLLDYLKTFLKERNRMIKKFAESDEWKLILNR
jgi:ligand-binding SRPBCC domain-containing protein